MSLSRIQEEKQRVIAEQEPKILFEKITDEDESKEESGTSSRGLDSTVGKQLSDEYDGFFSGRVSATSPSPDLSRMDHLRVSSPSNHGRNGPGGGTSL